MSNKPTLDILHSALDPKNYLTSGWVKMAIHVFIPST